MEKKNVDYKKEIKALKEELKAKEETIDDLRQYEKRFCNETFKNEQLQEENKRLRLDIDSRIYEMMRSYENIIMSLITKTDVILERQKQQDKFCLERPNKLY